MDAGIADTLNRHVVQLITRRLDQIDSGMDIEPDRRWQFCHMAGSFMGENDSVSDGDRAWLFGMLAARTPGVDFDGHPADCDWENLFSHFRAEILARRDPKTPSVRVAESPVRDGVGSQ